MDKDPRLELIEASHDGCLGCISIVAFALLTPIAALLILLTGLPPVMLLFAPVASGVLIWFLALKYG